MTPVAVGVGSLALARMRTTIPLGTIDLTGGPTTKTLDTAALAGGNVIITATLNNKLEPVQQITDCTVSIKRKGTSATPPNFGSVDVGNQSANGSATPAGAQSGGEGSAATVTGLTIDGLQTAQCTINGVNPGNGSEVTVNITPPVNDKPKNSSYESAVMAQFDFTVVRDLKRQGLSDMYHDRLCAGILNSDSVYDIVAINGTMTLPSGSVANVYLQDPANGFNAVPGASISTSSSGFSISNINLGPGDAYEVVVVLSTTYSGQGLRMELEAVY
ncbi:MAG: hypothetical protein ACF8XB_07550 [Planctomycetota bacterium JB042]